MKKVIRKFIKWLIVLLFAGVLILSGFVVAVYYGVFGPFPTTEELSSIQNEEASLVLSNNGEIIGKYFAENRTNISWNDIPEHLIDALVATEDKRFYLHEGYDGRSYLRVIFKTIILGDKSSGGGSTLTQQLVKNLYGRNDHSFMSMPVNKLKEAIIAVRIEDVLTKQQILLLYLNSVPFGEEVFGVEAASTRFFGKHCSELNVQESAVLVGLLKANTYYNPRLNPENAVRRRNQVLTLMNNEGYLSDNKVNELLDSELILSYSNYQKEAPAGYFVYRVKKRAQQIIDDLNLQNTEDIDIEKDGLKIYTTLDLSLQKSAQKSVRNQLVKMQKLLNRELKNSRIRKDWNASVKKKFGEQQLNNIKKRDVFSWTSDNKDDRSLSDSLWHYYSMLNAAVLITQPQSGRILTWIGGNNYRYLPYDLVLSKRQVASTIKPLIYTAGLEKSFVPCDYLNNEVVEYKEFDNWTPRNYNNSSSKDTLVALWYALANSMNLPTMDLYFQTGHDEVSDMLRRFGLDAPMFETPSIALGALDVSLYEMVLAYGAFANDGYISDDLIMIDRIIDTDGNVIYEKNTVTPNQIIDAKIADQITIILEKAVNEGTGRQLRNRFGLKSDLAGKTGTAQNYSDAWFMVYSPEIVIGTWVGARSPEVHFRGGLGSGSALALPIAGNILSDIESSGTLRKKYLTNFNHIYEDGQLIHCDPFFQKGLVGFINRVTNKGDDKEEDDSKTQDTVELKKGKKKSGIRKFFDKIFKGKKK